MPAETCLWIQAWEIVCLFFPTMLLKHVHLSRGFQETLKSSMNFIAKHNFTYLTHFIQAISVPLKKYIYKLKKKQVVKLSNFSKIKKYESMEESVMINILSVMIYFIVFLYEKQCRWYMTFITSTILKVSSASFIFFSNIRLLPVILTKILFGFNVGKKVLVKHRWNHFLSLRFSP